MSRYFILQIIIFEKNYHYVISEVCSETSSALRTMSLCSNLGKVSQISNQYDI